jgi:hypothetical protein
MNDDKANASSPTYESPGKPHNPPPIDTGLPPIDWRPFQALGRSLVFLLGIVCVFVFMDLLKQLAVADGGKASTHQGGSDTFFEAFVILYFAISAAGMAFAKRKAALIKFALAAYAALLTAFVPINVSLAKYAFHPGLSLNNAISIVQGAVFFIIFPLLPWHIIWLLKLLAKEKPTSQSRGSKNN